MPPKAKEDTTPVAESDKLGARGAIVGVQCWVKEGDTREAGPFSFGEIVSKDGPDDYKVKIQQGQQQGKTVKKSLTELLGSNDVKPYECSDLTKLMYIHEGAVSDVLRKRFVGGKIYTNVGAMLLVANPFKDLRLTTTEHVMQYRRWPKEEIMEASGEPHIFALCAKALHIFFDTQGTSDSTNISFVISGESGAGKTETTKHILSFFTTPKDGSEMKDRVSEAIMAGNPILEAFGNATTSRNNNSSRFGRLIRLYMEVESDGGVPAPKLAGGDVTPFLLEKSRITHAPEKDRNYHVFYQMCKSLQPQEMEDLSLPADWKTITFIKRTKQFDVPSAKENHDQNEWNEVLDAFRNINVSENQEQSVKRILAAVLLLGEINVVAVGDTEDVEPSDVHSVERAQEMLGLPDDAAGVGLFKGCAYKYRIIDGKETPCNVKIAEAQNNFCVLARAAYEKLFLWLIKKINDAVRIDEDSKMNWCAVLDIFGFEIMAVNSLEQLLINYANERLQQFFISSVFAAEKLAYEQEGVDPSCVQYEDNSSVIAVIDNERSKDGAVFGVLKMLNGTCINTSGTDATFLNDCKGAGYNAALFEPGAGAKANEMFIIYHTSGKVDYTITGFREKNMEILPDKQVQMVQESTELLLREIFEDLGAKGYTGQQFKQSINQLLDVLGDSMPFFIRCLKPNQTKIPLDYDFRVVVGQLTSLSIIDALQLAQKGYPSRLIYEKFMEKYHVLDLVYKPKGEESREKVLSMLNAMKEIPSADYKEGNTQIFMKKLTARYVESERIRIMSTGGRVVEDMVRLESAARTGKMYNLNRERLIMIQAYGRGFRSRLVIRRRKRRKHALWGTCSWIFRIRRFQRDRLAALTFQTAVREFMSFAKMIDLVQQQQDEAAVLKLQLYLKVLEARQHMLANVATDRMARIDLVTQKIARLWVIKINLTRFWMWRAMIPPMKREFQRRLYRITKLQAMIRGALQRRTPTALKVQARVRARRHAQAVKRGTICVQRMAKSWWIKTLYDQAYEAAGTVQSYYRNKVEATLYSRKLRSCVKIQCAFRRWVAQMVIVWEKLKVMHTAEQAFLSKLTRLERKRAGEMVGVKPLSLIDVTCHQDTTPFYPEGWTVSFAKMLRTDSVRKVAFGAEHTLVLGRNGLYSWGSNEVGQLGLGELDGSGNHEKKGKPKPPVFTFVAPILRQKVLDICCGRWHCVAHVQHNGFIREDGITIAPGTAISCWGLNHRGQCGVKSFQAKEPFTPVYPKIVRAPTFPSLDGQVIMVSAGPFSTGVLVQYHVGEHPFVWMWGEGNACGQPKDVGIPMTLNTDSIRYPLQTIVLGDGIGFVKHGQGIHGWGTKCAALGIGYEPKTPQRHSYGVARVDCRVRCDAHPQLNLPTLLSGELVPSPVPLIFPQKQITNLCVAEDHVCAHTVDYELYEWGCRRVLKVHKKGAKTLLREATDSGHRMRLLGIKKEDKVDLSAKSIQDKFLSHLIDSSKGPRRRDEDDEGILVYGEDLGLCYLPTPQRLETSHMGGSVREIRAAGDVSLAQKNDLVPVGWQCLELHAWSPNLVFKPLLFNYRMLQHAHRFEVYSASALTCVLGQDPNWTDLPQEKVPHPVPFGQRLDPFWHESREPFKDPTSPTRPRGATQVFQVLKPADDDFQVNPARGLDARREPPWRATLGVPINEPDLPPWRTEDGSPPPAPRLRVSPAAQERMRAAVAAVHEQQGAPGKVEKGWDGKTGRRLQPPQSAAGSPGRRLRGKSLGLSNSTKALPTVLDAFDGDDLPVLYKSKSTSPVRRNHRPYRRNPLLAEGPYPTGGRSYELKAWAGRPDASAGGSLAGKGLDPAFVSAIQAGHDLNTGVLEPQVKMGKDHKSRRIAEIQQLLQTKSLDELDVLAKMVDFKSK